ncbi:MAG: hypothetical protein PUA52_05965, partial [Lachnospiraceae bacterium]|nr:hypothetical protein [Lachnospiraceae bacterium]
QNLRRHFSVLPYGKMNPISRLTSKVQNDKMNKRRRPFLYANGHDEIELLPTETEGIVEIEPKSIR